MKAEKGRGAGRKTNPLLLFFPVAVVAATVGTGCVKTDLAAAPAAVPATAESPEELSGMELWCANVRPVLPCVPYAGTPTDLKLLDEKGPLALYSGKTAEDAAFVAAQLEMDPETPLWRNSLFLRRPVADGGHEWRVILTSGTTWKTPEGEDSWPVQDPMYDLKMCLHVLDAKFSSDRRHIWLELDPHSHTWFAICSYDLQDNVLDVLCGGSGMEICPDGTLHVKNLKTYLYDENGESLGAAFYDRWITPDGTVVRESEPHQ